MSKNLAIGLIITGVVISIIVFLTIGKSNEVQKIKESSLQTTCLVTGHGIPKKSSDTHYGVWVEYEYTVEAKTYHHQKKYYFPKDDETYLKGNSFPLIYSSNDPDLNRILIINTDFEEFGMQQPDSLKQYNSKIY